MVDRLNIMISSIGSGSSPATQDGQGRVEEYLSTLTSEPQSDGTIKFSASDGTLVAVALPDAGGKFIVYFVEEKAKPKVDLYDADAKVCRAPDAEMNGDQTQVSAKRFGESSPMSISEDGPACEEGKPEEIDPREEWIAWSEPEKDYSDESDWVAWSASGDDKALCSEEDTAQTEGTRLSDETEIEKIAYVSTDEDGGFSPPPMNSETTDDVVGESREPDAMAGLADAETSGGTVSVGEPALQEDAMASQTSGTEMSLNDAVQTQTSIAYNDPNLGSAISANRFCVAAVQTGDDVSVFNVNGELEITPEVVLQQGAAVCFSYVEHPEGLRQDGQKANTLVQLDAAGRNSSGAVLGRFAYLPGNVDERLARFETRGLDDVPGTREWLTSRKSAAMLLSETSGRLEIDLSQPVQFAFAGYPTYGVTFLRQTSDLGGQPPTTIQSPSVRTGHSPNELRTDDPVKPLIASRERHGEEKDDGKKGHHSDTNGDNGGKEEEEEEEGMPC